MTVGKLDGFLNVKNSFFSLLKLTFQRFSQLLFFSKSEFKIAALLSGSFNASDTLVSSAKCFITDSIFFGYVVYIYEK